MTKSLYGAPIEDKQHYPKLAQIQFNLKELYPEAKWTKLTEIQLDTLQWAKEFMDKYEKAREKTPKGGIRGEEGKLFSEVY